MRKERRCRLATKVTRHSGMYMTGQKSFFLFFSPQVFGVARPNQVLALVGMAPERYTSVGRTHVGVSYVAYAERISVEPEHLEVRPRQQDAAQRGHLGR